MMRRDGVRAAISRRFHGLPFGLSNPITAVLWPLLVRAFWLLYFGFVVLVLVLRYSVLPHIEDYRADIERLASRELGLAVSIGRIEASWEGINPDLSLLDVRVADAEGRPTLAFSKIQAILSWWSVPSGQLTLRLLSIDEPTLNLRRDTSGRFYIAGIPLSQEESGGGVSEWILAQKRIRIRGATLVWDDELRSAPSLILEDLNFALDNDGKHHRFGLTALPPEGLASKIDVRGDFRGTDVEQMKLWSGQAYAEIGYADLAVWRQWVDYPVALPHGQGAVRAWLGFAEGGLREITADVSLQDIGLRFSPELPFLELDKLSGRLRTRFTETGAEVTGRHIELVTQPIAARKTETQERRESIRVEPTDFYVNWNTSAEDKKNVGSATANRIDIGVLSKLAEYLPFDTGSRQLLNAYAPHGKVSALAATWAGTTDSLQSYSLKAGFDELALKAQGYFPGFSGLSGSVELNEKSGRVSLLSKAASVDLPSVFPESLIALEVLNAEAKWKVNRGVLDAELSRIEFSGPDAAGSAQGTYRNAGDGPGVIDLTAALTRGNARAVWRYMPHEINADTRMWLRDSLLAGSSSDAKLSLKGDLAHFPFLDKKQGQFLVTAKAHDVTLDYGTGWPKITGLNGDLRFEGNGMTIDVQQGSILGAQLSGTHAEIPDFDAPVSTLRVLGKAAGPTAEFLKFIDQSPVAARIDRFTEDMRASGDGHLDLDLLIPLAEARLNDSRIDGTYAFSNNEVMVDTALPPLRQVNGHLQFSGSDLRIPEITAVLFGGPLTIKGGSQKDGRVLISAHGSVNIEPMRKLSDSPLLAALSGATPFRGEIRINKRNADLVIDSMLVGLASSLPEPFAKVAGASFPLRLEKKLLPSAPVSKARKQAASAEPVRDQLSASLGKVLSMQLIRRKQKEGFVAERGAIAIGRPLVLPDSGVTLGVSATQIDLDSWRRVLASAGTSAVGQDAAPSPIFPLDSISLKTDSLMLLGRQLDNVELTASSTLSQQWKIALNSRQASGDLLWDGAGNGKVTARLRQVTMDIPPTAVDAEEGVGIEKLPALDVVAEDFALGKRRFGRVELQASNDAGVWQLHKIQATNSSGSLSGSGQWKLSGGKSRTQLDFKIDSTDVGKLLDRMDYRGAVRGGTAQLEGKIGWNGRPTGLDYGSLEGKIHLEAGKGQFVKLDPGAAGKLLGLISLQGLPRRITLDFKDVFSEGFAFDSMASTLTIKNGLMRTERLQIDGPSARVLMRGEVDLERETQQLDVNVQPELGGTAALGIALLNPVAGVATWVAHKVLQNPLNHVFGFNYRVTGKWDDPKVEKVTGAVPVTNIPRLPTIANPTGVENEPSPR